jgi:hypothetical protein
MKIEVKPNCPLNNFEPCKQMECAWFIKVVGKNPNTGEDIEDWGCSIAWMPIMMVENSQMQRQTSAAVESFRNEMVKNNEVGQRVLLAAAGVSPQAQKMILEND